MGQGSRRALAFTARHMSNQIPLVIGCQASIRALAEAADCVGLAEAQPTGPAPWQVPGQGRGCKDR